MNKFNLSTMIVSGMVILLAVIFAQAGAFAPLPFDSGSGMRLLDTVPSVVIVSPSLIITATPHTTPIISETLDARLGAAYAIERVSAEQEVFLPELNSLFPGSKFYLVRFDTLPATYEIAAVWEDTVYKMPDDFNKLLVATGAQVTEDDWPEMGRTFVLLTQREALVAPVAFSQETRIREKDAGRSEMLFQVKLVPCCKSNPTV